MHLVLAANAGFNLLNFRAGLIRALQADGHRLTALVPRSDDDAALRAMGLEVVPLRLDARGMNPLAEAVAVGAIRATLRRLRPDAVLSWTIKTNLYAALAARPLGLPVLPNVSGLGTAFLGSPWAARAVEALYRRAFRDLPAVFFQNPDDRALFVARGLVRPAQVRMLPGSGIDLGRFAPAPLPGAGPRYLMVARLLRDKGVVEFAQAAARLGRPGAPARFALLGAVGAANRSALSRADLDALLGAAGGALEWLGATDDVRPHIAAADVVVLPSYREGTPRTLLEGAAMGRPLVATDVPGCREVVIGGETGLMCRPRDAADLARAMHEMDAAGPAARARMGAAARAHVERRFDERLVVAAYREALAAACAAAPA